MGFEFQELQGRLLCWPRIEYDVPESPTQGVRGIPELSCQGAGVTWLVALTSSLEMTP